MSGAPALDGVAGSAASVPAGGVFFGDSPAEAFSRAPSPAGAAVPPASAFFDSAAGASFFVGALADDVLAGALDEGAGFAREASTFFGAAFFESALFGAAFFGAAVFGAAFFGAALFGAAFFDAAFFGAAFFDAAFFGAAFFASAFFGGAAFGAGGLFAEALLEELFFGVAGFFDGVDFPVAAAFFGDAAFFLVGAALPDFEAFFGAAFFGADLPEGAFAAGAAFFTGTAFAFAPAAFPAVFFTDFFAIPAFFGAALSATAFFAMAFTDADFLGPALPPPFPDRRAGAREAFSSLAFLATARRAPDPFAGAFPVAEPPAPPLSFFVAIEAGLPADGFKWAQVYPHGARPPTRWMNVARRKTERRGADGRPPAPLTLPDGTATAVRPRRRPPCSGRCCVRHGRSPACRTACRSRRADPDRHPPGRGNAHPDTRSSRPSSGADRLRRPEGRRSD